MSVGAGATTGAEDGVEHRTELGRELGEFAECFFENGRELEEAEGVSRWCGVEDYDVVGEGFYLFEDFCEGHCFVDAGYLKEKKGGMLELDVKSGGETKKKKGEKGHVIH